MGLEDGVVNLRPPAAEDAVEVADVVVGSLPTLSEWLPWATPDYSVATAREWIASCGAPGLYPFVVRDAHGAVVGGCGLQHADEPNRCIELGYWIAARHTGQGYATRAARLAVEHAFGELGFHRVQILVSVHNLRSQALAERLGARREARLRERLLVRGDWHDAFLYALVT
jgi:ribosomal-protein-serine acetyltransferase